MKYCSFIKFFIFFIFLFFLLLFFPENDNGVSSNFSVDNQIPSLDIYNKKYVKDIRFNKVIIIGDSRMERLRDRGESIKIPSNFSFIVKGGSKIKWFEEKALNDLSDVLDKSDEKYKYHVVINMGVNDLEDYYDYLVYSNSYYILIRQIIKKYPNVNFYFLSVNPIIESILNEWQPWSFRTNDKIEKFNKSLDVKIKLNNFDNYYYCNSNENIDFNIPDGIHYDKNTDQLIVNYVVNSCLKY